MISPFLITTMWPILFRHVINSVLILITTVRVSLLSRMDQAVNCTDKVYVPRVLMELDHKIFMQDQTSRNSLELLQLDFVLINTMYTNGQ
jgi:hypothetical protein